MRGIKLANQNQMTGKKNRSVMKINFSDSFVALKRLRGEVRRE